MAPQITLTEEEIDEILYIARANETTELEPYLSTLTAKYPSTTNPQILSSAIDPQSGNTTLHYAGANGHLEIINLLLSQFTQSQPSPAIPESLKDFVNTTNKQGSTALHFTALNGHLEIVKVLIGNGADASVLNGAGYDCVFEAERNGKSEVVEWLLREAVGLEVGVRGISGSAEGSSRDQEMGGADEEGEEGEDVSFTVRVGDTSGEMEEVDVTEGMEGLDVDGERKEKGKGNVNG